MGRRDAGKMEETDRIGKWRRLIKSNTNSLKFHNWCSMT